MTTLVVGGAASGKSEWAETLLMQQAAHQRIYIATMQVWDEECRQRVNRHRAMRAEKAFETLEAPLGLLQAAQKVPADSAVLLEDITNLCANEMFDVQGAGKNACPEILAGVQVLAEKCAALVIVSGDTASGGSEYEGETLAYLKTLAKINNALAQRADCVYEAVAGMLVRHK